MSLPVHLFNKFIVGGDSGVSGDMSLTINSLATNIDEAVSYSIQASFTGAYTGVIQLQASNDIVKGSNAQPTNWTSITDSEADITVALNYMVNVELPSYSWVRLVYTPTGGTGTMVANINAKRR